MVNHSLTDDDLLLLAIGLVKAARHEASAFLINVALTFEALTDEWYLGSHGGWSDGVYAREPIFAMYPDGVADLVTLSDGA